MESTNQPYLFPEARSLDNAERGLSSPREDSVSRVMLHVALLAATAVTSTLTGAALEAQNHADSFGDSIFGPVVAVLSATAAGHFELLAKGLLFAFTLLGILAAHELGHYFACRYYGIRATLPFFIPAPPVLSLLGTLGAVIKIKEPIQSRRALFDIGIAGPLAGFAFALPASVIGLLFAKSAYPAQSAPSGSLLFQDPLLFIIITKLFGLPAMIEWNPVYWAAWGTLLVTALNLFPVGQLDGGHVLYAVAGQRIHKWVARLTVVAVAALAAFSWLRMGFPTYAPWLLVLLFLMKVGHPPIVVEESLGRARIILALVAAAVFLLCFMPFPIIIT